MPKIVEFDGKATRAVLDAASKPKPTLVQVFTNGMVVTSLLGVFRKSTNTDVSKKSRNAQRHTPSIEDAFRNGNSISQELEE